MHFKAQGDRRVHLGNFFARHGQAEEIGADAAVFFRPGDTEKSELPHFVKDRPIECFFFIPFFYGRHQPFFGKVPGQVGYIRLHFR